MNPNPQSIAIEAFDYALPEDRIAKFPLAERDASKLLVYRQGAFSEACFAGLADFLPEDSLLVFNDTKVVSARLLFRKESGSTIEIFCLEPWGLPVASAFEQRSEVRCKCLIGNNRRWKQPVLEKRFSLSGKEVCLCAEREEKMQDAWIVRFHWNQEVSFAEILEHAGEVPLPPYLHRAAEAGDKERYQTIYAHYQGSVAAPTAGLHFTPRVFGSLKAKQIETEYLTLHVGAGTFKPVSSETIGEHEMHVEQLWIAKKKLERILRHQGRPLIAVGTTTTRTLESLYWFGVQLTENPDTDGMHVSQWEPYQKECTLPAAQALEAVLAYMERHNLDFLAGETRLMIAPPYRFRLVHGLVTNFHQPKSTLLLLVSALIGDAWREGYRYALEHGFRFLSYGDSCLFLPQNIKN
ncbi:MAG: S-adenosylmethionine:tRNA ribosyltransferase-isomerase [Bacteroidales bacterium]|nr:S-adenosylmethionine:tRNA ribosyltransferase-isomerase [Bacteroidales bacterium]